MEKAMSGGLVDFIENVVFEEYKDQPLHSAKWFRSKVKEKYKLKHVSDLYVRLINYQVAKYGSHLMQGKDIAYVENAANKSRKCRRNHVETARTSWELKKFMNRMEKKNGTKKMGNKSNVRKHEGK